MIIDTLNDRALYVPGDKVEWKHAKPVKVNDDRACAVYINTLIDEGSTIGEHCFLLGCKVLGKTRIGAHSVVSDNTFFGDSTIIYDGARIGSGCCFGNNAIFEYNLFIESQDHTHIEGDCRFGDGASLKMPVEFKGKAKFGDNTNVGEGCTFFQLVEFGKRAVITGYCEFHYGVQFKEMPQIPSDEKRSGKVISSYHRSNGSIETYPQTLAEYLRLMPF